MAANFTPFVSGAVLTAAQLNGVVDNFQDIAIFNETQASGTAGGTFTSGSYIKRTLNTTVVNNITGCSIASSVITLPAGTYEIFASAPAFGVNGHQIQIQDTTAATTIGFGSTMFTDSGQSIQSTSIVNVAFTLSVTSNIELQHRCETTKASNGLGRENSFGNSNIYSQIQIARIA